MGLVRTASALNSTHNLSRNIKISEFLSETFQFLVVSIYLNRRLFVTTPGRFFATLPRETISVTYVCFLANKEHSEKGPYFKRNDFDFFGCICFFFSF